MFVCPECHKQVKDLPGHLRRVHPEQAKKAAANPGNTTLEIAAPKTEKPKAEAHQYHCVDCGHSVTRNITSCPGCGATLDWSQL